MADALLPSPEIAALQKQIREYVSLLTLIKKKREEMKTLNSSLKAMGEDIMHSMSEQNIPSCVSMGYTFSVKEKAKMKSATAKSFMNHVQQYFKISEPAMAEFVEIMNRRRRDEAEIITTLECKTQQKKRSPEPSDSIMEDGGNDTPSLSTTIDDMYA